MNLRLAKKWAYTGSLFPAKIMHIISGPALWGFSAVLRSLVYDYRKGIRGFDAEKAYEGILKNATQAIQIEEDV